MSIMLVSDIFGKTPALITLADELNAKVIVDPYDGEYIKFNDELEAYAYFMENVGFDAYLVKLLAAINIAGSDITLIGFSIGASAVWKLSEQLSLNNVSRGICYYGSQIRYFKEVEPSFEIELIFPKYEEHFDVLKLQEELALKKNTKMTKTNYLHGFMNLYSINYTESAYNEQLNWLRINANE